MPVQIGLVDGTKLTLADQNVREDDVIAKLNGTGRPDHAAIGFISFDTRQGTFRVNPTHVVYVKEVKARTGDAAFV
jgi:hypothetical protein